MTTLHRPSLGQHLLSGKHLETEPTTEVSGWDLLGHSPQHPDS